MWTPHTDRRLLRRSALARHGRTGRAAPPVSKAADRGIVWPVLGAVLAVVVRPPLAVLLVPAAAAISGARVGIAHHYPSDVAAGAAVGVLVGSTVGVVLRRRARPGPCPGNGSGVVLTR
ncbi:MAG: phosphatase PAP2 family protein [Sporichthyaceae bacterium]